jgi:hypothetical protein
MKAKFVFIGSFNALSRLRNVNQVAFLSDTSLNYGCEVAPYAFPEVVLLKMMEINKKYVIGKRTVQIRTSEPNILPQHLSYFYTPRSVIKCMKYLLH